MEATEKNLLIAGIAAAILYAITRTERGQAVTVDALQGIIAAGKDLLSPRGIRNNNPGNIEYSPNPSARWRGTIGSDGRFAIFDTAANGIRAIAGELRASIRKGQTIKQAIYEWAPPGENDSDAYAAAVAREIRAHPDARLTSDMVYAATVGIIKHENGVQPYDPAYVQTAVNS